MNNRINVKFNVEIISKIPIGIGWLILIIRVDIKIIKIGDRISVRRMKAIMLYLVYKTKVLF
jgi:hypothetical protein